VGPSDSPDERDVLVHLEPVLLADRHKYNSIDKNNGAKNTAIINLNSIQMLRAFPARDSPSSGCRYTATSECRSKYRLSGMCAATSQALAVADGGLWQQHTAATCSSLLWN